MFYCTHNPTVGLALPPAGAVALSQSADPHGRLRTTHPLIPLPRCTRLFLEHQLPLVPSGCGLATSYRVLLVGGSGAVNQIGPVLECNGPNLLLVAVVVIVLLSPHKSCIVWKNKVDLQINGCKKYTIGVYNYNKVPRRFHCLGPSGPRRSMSRPKWRHHTIPDQFPDNSF